MTGGTPGLLMKIGDPVRRRRIRLRRKRVALRNPGRINPTPTFLEKKGGLVDLAGLILKYEPAEGVYLFLGQGGLTVRLVKRDRFSGHNGVIFDMDFADARTGPGINQDKGNDCQSKKAGKNRD